MGLRKRDKVVVLSELLLLAEKSSITLNLRKMQIIQLCNKRIENMQAEYWAEFPETPMEIFEAFMELILVDNNLRMRASLTDASTDKLIEDPYALTMFQLWNRFRKFIRDCLLNKKPQKHPSSVPDHGKGPAVCTYTFYSGSNNQEWIDEFVKKANVVMNDPCLKNMKHVGIKLCRIEELIKRSGKKVPHGLRDYFVSGSYGRFVLTSMIRDQEKLLLDDDGEKILKVLEAFHKQWKDNIKMPKNSFGVSFVDYYQNYKEN